MIKDRMKNAKGITLTTLAITIAVLMILLNVIVYNVAGSLTTARLEEMRTDIDNLREKISSYYAQYGKIPARLSYPNINHLKVEGVISEAIDTGDFLVIDLSAIENLTLNRGKDFEKIKLYDTLTTEQAKENTDIYIINETSHNIFYVEGVKIDNQTFYTDVQEVDTAPIDFRYVEGVKIPEGFYYAGGSKTLGNIFIKNSDNTETYKWIVVEESITEIPTDIEIKAEEKEDFIRSVNSYQGYYQNTDNNTVKYFTLEKWSPVYDQDSIYQDKNGDTAYVLKDFQVSELPGENTIEEGLIVKDSNQNEWVWIEVPKSIYTNIEYNGGIEPVDSEDYNKIESVMKEYTKDYRDSNYEDSWNSAELDMFSSVDDYNDWKKSMLKSVYEKGGFYIGRYEVGVETERKENTDGFATPIIQRNVYPYNFVTSAQAHEQAKKLKIGENTTSLMFGIQWDLVLKFIETRGVKTQEELKNNSVEWGNYSDSEFTIIKGKYAVLNQASYELGEWNEVNNTTKAKGSASLLTTGATDRNSILGIYDLSGNVWEWTLEKGIDSSNLYTKRGGGCDSSDENSGTTSSRNNSSSSVNSSNIGFRAVLW